MRPTHPLDRVRGLFVVAAVVAATAFATAPVASAASLPSPGNVESCVGVSGGFLLQIQGYGLDFPPNSTGTLTFTFANGDVFVVTATADAQGNFHADPFTLDLRDPEIAALVDTFAYETANFGSIEVGLVFPVVGCPTTPDGRVACMDGGFEQYPALGFLNQGDCVSWVATNAKNEPGKNRP
jgi:hypothetical protein